MTKVYCVFRENYDSSDDLIAIYSTQQAALEFVLEQSTFHNYDVEEWIISD